MGKDTATIERPCKSQEEEIQEIKNTLRHYDKQRGIVDTFWENFNSSRCKTAMLIITVIITIVFGLSILFQIPNENLTVIMMGVVGFWSGRSTKAKDVRIE